MTESEWLSLDNPQRMLEVIGAPYPNAKIRRVVSDHKLRLWVEAW